MKIAEITTTRATKRKLDTVQLEDAVSDVARVMRALLHEFTKSALEDREDVARRMADIQTRFLKIAAHITSRGCTSSTSRAGT